MNPAEWKGKHKGTWERRVFQGSKKKRATGWHRPRTVADTPEQNDWNTAWYIVLIRRQRWIRASREEPAPATLICERLRAPGAYRWPPETKRRARGRGCNEPAIAHSFPRRGLLPRCFPRTPDNSTSSSQFLAIPLLRKLLYTHRLPSLIRLQPFIWTYLIRFIFGNSESSTQR